VVSEPETTARRGRPRSTEKHDAILAAARALFTQEPYERVSLDAVAEAAGVSKVTIYSHFPDKHSLFVEAISSGCATTFERIEMETPDSAPLDEVLVAFGCDFLTTIFDPEIERLHAVILSESRRRPELPKMFYDTVVHRLTTLFADYLQRQAGAGRLRIGDPYTAAVQFLAMVQGEFRYRVDLGMPNATPEERKAYVRDCVATLLRAWSPGHD
jgi:TetR/AcrR family transcriptional regulator, mexJK operon transcriptional repressor